jgi:hypothetical protein
VTIAQVAPRDRAQLHRTATEMHPDRLPFYVATPSRPGQGAGWYWTPAGASAPQMLGANVYMAEAQLLHLAAAGAS